MSGGVDSSVTAALLLKAGAEVRGVFMRLAQPGVERHQERAAAVAAHLGIPLEVIDLGEPFRQEVLAYFSAGYFSGRTPNPCVICNQRIKFGLLMERALAGGSVTDHEEHHEVSDLLATGHYARISRDPAGGYHLRQGLDPRKDQSYFLCLLSQAQLGRMLFPLGEKTKVEVYGLAAELGLAGRHGRESQDVCFLAEQSAGDFLASLAPAAAETGGLIVTRDGRELGRHRGVYHYTVGQRRGLGLPDVTPYYVVALDAARHLVVVGKEDELYRRRVRLRTIHWLAGSPPPLPLDCRAKIRYRHQPAPARLEIEAATGAPLLTFDEPQRAATPGQFAVLYHEDEVLAGGEIATACRRLGIDFGQGHHFGSPDPAPTS